MAIGRAFSTLLWLPVNLLQALFTLLWTATLVLAALAVTTIAGRGPALAMARRFWAPGLLACAGAQLVVRGGERVDFARAHLFVANHESWIDVPALFRALPTPLHFVAKRELARVPLLGRYISAMGMVYVDRVGARSARRSVDAATALLAAGSSVVSFPQGTRAGGGRRAPFKSGGFGAALAAGAPVVPVALVGCGAVLPRGGFRVRPGRIEVRIGAPIEVGSFAPDDRAGLAGAAERAVAALLDAGPPAPEREWSPRSAEAER